MAAKKKMLKPGSAKIATAKSAAPVNRGTGKTEPAPSPARIFPFGKSSKRAKKK